MNLLTFEDGPVHYRSNLVVGIFTINLQHFLFEQQHLLLTLLWKIKAYWLIFFTLKFDVVRTAVRFRAFESIVVIKGQVI